MFLHRVLRRHRILSCGCALLLVIGLAGAARALEAAGTAAVTVEAVDEDLFNMSLEDLMNVEITSVSKYRQKVSQAPAAVSVISQDDIRRSGMTSIAEVLRLSPGLNVARVDANKWAISSRGFNDVFANKLLVLMDGRTVYTPAFSGVYWDTVDYVLPDLDRIEVIRGPGATLWGANAVNGVINITSKNARDTQGWLVDGVAGTEEQIGSVRYGGKIDDRTYYRVYGKYRNVDDAVFSDGERAQDGWQAMRSGFRLDRFASDADTLTFQGDAYAERTGQTATFASFMPPTFTQRVDDVGNESGSNLLARWTHVISPVSDFALQLYYDNVQRDDPYGKYNVNTFDIDFQHRFELASNQHVVWGTGFRFMTDDFATTGFTVDPRTRDTYLLSAFVQDDITLVKDRLHLFLGSKFEQNSYTGFEVQPSARMLWTPSERTSIWGAVSRAVRTPSRSDEDSRVPLVRTVDPQSGLPLELDITGNNQLYSEQLVAYEVGYRSQVTKTFSVDAAAFYNVYDNLLSFSPQAPQVVNTVNGPLVLIDAPRNNKRRADTYGLELAANWNVMDNWRLAASYTWLNVMVHSSSSDHSPQPESATEDNVPRNQAQIRSYFDLTRDLEFNAAAYYVENLAAANIPSYVRVDLGLTWRPIKGAELTAGVQNLLDDRHKEFDGQFGVTSTEMQRAVYLQFLYRF
jgi:iron complex outermembrane receptor protein